ncbi:MAG: 5'/3'-nucleotidase SurE [Phycisphaerales bacterium JB037]
MRILLTNDDGIRAPGIIALFEALAGHHPEFDGPILGKDTKVFVVAPETVQSATSHGVTFHEPLMTRDVQVTDEMAGIAVDGRPADCVKLALSTLWPEHFGKGNPLPDLVVSGMNAGANAGVNVIYSGTVAAAIEAAFLGVPSIAVSLHLGHHRPLFEVASGHARRAIEAILRSGPLERHECLSINIPRTEELLPRDVARPGPFGSRLGPTGPDAEETLPSDYDPTIMPPIRVCPMNTHGLIDKYERRVSPSGDVYYWAAGDGLAFFETDRGTDVHELFDRAITVTPLSYDLTRQGAMGRWRDRLAGHDRK